MPATRLDRCASAVGTSSSRRSAGRPSSPTSTAVGGREYAEAGGLFPYAVSYPELFQRAAGYVDKILRGAKPADLPVEQPTIPQSLLQRANHLIE